MSDVTNLPAPTWLIGCGNMAGAMVAGWRASGIDLSVAVAIRPSGTQVEGVRTVTSIADATAAILGETPKLAILGFKPQQIDQVAAELAPRLGADTIVLSLLAGVEAASLRARFPAAGAVVRAIPNLPVAVRRGVIALYSADASEAVRQEVANIIAPLGFAPWMNEESGLAGVGAVAGAGPAYVARFIDALAKAGEKRGLSRQMAATIALETVFGTAWMAVGGEEDMARIARRVASPNGTTEAGLGVLDRDGVLDSLIAAAIDAAAARGAQLAADARLS